MEGNNVIIFNQATMNKAVEYYLRSIFREQYFEVSDVTYTQDEGFRVHLACDRKEAI